MWNRRVAVSGLAVAAVALVGACADVPPTEPHASEPEFEGSAFFSQARFGAPEVKTLDAEFAQLAQEIPGFGGFFLDEAGQLNVYMAPARGVPMLSAAQLVPALGLRLQALGLEAEAVQQLRVREGQYDFHQLATWHQQMLPVFSVGGVIFTDADERVNRLRIGIEAGASEAAVEQALQRLGIPREAVIIEVTEPIVRDSDHTLRDRQRPVAGGLQINFRREPSGFVCTHGFNARVPGVRANFFFTNAHCSEVQGETNFTAYWQPLGGPDLESPNLIGFEIFDPPFFTGDECLDGWRCRWSDALVAEYLPDVSVAFGRLWQTTFGGVRHGSMVVTGSRPAWRIVGENPRPVVGQMLHKTGRTRGWTYGTVEQTCVLTTPGGGILLLCQDRIRTGSAGGDSGSPYFERIGTTNRVRLAGLHWGSSPALGLTVMSSMQNIRMDIPGPWITH